jgi:hypothetical protein
VIPPQCRIGSNENAFVGGFRLWENAGDGAKSATSTPEAGEGSTSAVRVGIS